MTKIVELVKGRQVDLDRLVLVSGAGELPGPEGEVRCCVRTARAWVLGKSHSDQLLPGESAVVRALEIGINDGLSNERRVELKRHVARPPVPYVSDELEHRRALRVCDWYVRTCAAALFELLNEPAMAGELRALPPLNSQEAWKAAEPVLARALDLARARARALALALDLALDLARALARALDRARALDLALARALDLALDLARALDLDLARVLDLARALARALEESALALLDEIVAMGAMEAIEA